MSAPLVNCVWTANEGINGNPFHWLLMNQINTVSWIQSLSKKAINASYEWMNTVSVMNEHRFNDEWTPSQWWTKSLSKKAIHATAMSERTPFNDERTPFQWWTNIVSMMNKHRLSDEPNHCRRRPSMPRLWKMSPEADAPCDYCYAQIPTWFAPLVDPASGPATNRWKCRHTLATR